MSISVHCEPCGKTYQLRDEMAGRKGKCPKGHTIHVPLPASPAEAVDDNAFAFTADTNASRRDDDVRVAKPARRKSESVSGPAAEDEFAFPTQVAGASRFGDEVESPSKSDRRSDSKFSSKIGKPAGKSALMPLIAGGVLAVLGVGGGITMLLVSRGEAQPLREQAEAANKKARDAEDRAQKADALRLLAESDLEKFKKNPPKDPAFTDAQAKLKTAERRATEAERKLADGQKGAGALAGAPTPPKEIDPTAPGGSADPVLPGGKLDPAKKKEMEKPAEKKDTPAKQPAEMADGVPIGGKNWTAPGSATVGMSMLKAGDRVWLWPQEDVTPKVVDGKLIVKFRWQLRKGKELPELPSVGLLVQHAMGTKVYAGQLKLSGQGGVADASFDAKDLKGKLPATIFIGNGQLNSPVAYSSFLAFTVDFGSEKK